MIEIIILVAVSTWFLTYCLCGAANEARKKARPDPAGHASPKELNVPDEFQALNAKVAKYREVMLACKETVKTLSEEQERYYNAAEHSEKTRNVDKYIYYIHKADSMTEKIARKELQAANMQALAIKTEKQMEKIKARR